MAKLTGRQQQIVRMLVGGTNQKEIARQLGISYKTVRGHLQEAREKTGTRSSLDLAVKVALEEQREG